MTLLTLFKTVIVINNPLACSPPSKHKHNLNVETNAKLWVFKYQS